MCIRDRDRSLNDHLTNVLGKILLDNPKNAYDILEEYSLYTKTQGYDFKNPKNLTDANMMREPFSEISAYVEKLRPLIDKFANVNPDEPPADDAGAPCGYVPNVIEESRMLEHAGIYFGEEETFKLMKSLTKLSQDKQAKQVRFWGKILGSTKDYWIAEGKLEGQEPDPLMSKDGEQPGSGINTLVHWVTTDLTEPWVQLEAVTPAQIATSRLIKYIFTGDLERDVITNPNFKGKSAPEEPADGGELKPRNDANRFGKEKHLLKCQIIRITHSTSLVPADLYRRPEGSEDPNEIEMVPADDEEAQKKALTFQDLAKKDNWVHIQQSILREGRLTYYEPEIEDEDQKKKVMDRKKVVDPMEARLKPISQDKAPKGYEQAWTLKISGDMTNYGANSLKVKNVNYGNIIIRSIVWPGSVLICQNGAAGAIVYTSVYVGYGFKNEAAPFFPKYPQDVLEEPEDKDEQPEPNGEKPVEVDPNAVPDL
eukprot:TRINITY_DN7467_c0_g1_i7.p1 TRINITY_DN7467_c0_g1~~TRINITY_DN7467_c0_g1_i7.p1  ORF type:complete len:482 (+),score=133.08 TRINITY_DN7467_c0_g1_i7:97-1542(+)